MHYRQGSLFTIVQPYKGMYTVHGGRTRSCRTGELTCAVATRTEECVVSGRESCLPVLPFSTTCLSAGDATLPALVASVSAGIASLGLRIQMVCDVTTTFHMTFRRVRTAVSECDVRFTNRIIGLTSEDVSSVELYVTWFY
jgi:hypothetical protein